MEQDNPIIVGSVRRIAKGSLIIFITLIIAYIIAFVSRIILARYLGPSDFGLFNIAISIVTIVGTFSTLSVPIGIARYIPIYKLQNNSSSIRGIILSSLRTVMILSILMTVLVFFATPWISNIYRAPTLRPMLIIFSISIPFSAIIAILSSIFQGFQEASQSAFFKNLLMNLIRLILYSMVVIFSLGLFGIIYSYLLAISISAIAFSLYFIIKIGGYIEWKWQGTSEYRSLLIFSMPMFIGGVVWNLAGQINILIFGYYHTAYYVGIFGTVTLLQTVLFFIIEAISFLYLPVYSALFSMGQKYEMMRTFQVLTKWMFLTSLPALAMFILYPNFILEVLFGVDYTAGSTAMIIVSLGTSVLLLGSLVGNSLIAMGKTRMYMLISILMAVMSNILGIILIPSYSLLGIALATLGSYIFGSCLLLLVFYRKTQFHPFSRALIKPTIIYILMAIFIFIGLNILRMTPNIISLVFISLIFIILLPISVIIGDALETSDIEILRSIERRSGLNLGTINKIIKKIVR